ncbi:MAG: zinc-binding dehydrogenase [Caldilineales bacterium]|nr:zinc-binding dehydrogenase [Caldilineales bacterium]MCX7852458.1 zinc-binding dehydrogenase [Caldilineales bacterium]
MRTIYVDKHIPKILAVKALKPVWGDVVYAPLSPVRFAEIPDPPLPGPRWLRVRNRVCGICASDLSLLHVEADPQIGPAALPGNQRFYLGHEVVSIVTEVEPGVTRFKPGDRVIMQARFQGAHCRNQEIEPLCRHCAEGNYILCENASRGIGPRGVGGGWGDGYTAHESELYPVPDDLSDDQAAMVEPLAVGVRTALRRLPAPGEKALVVGCGIVGLNLIQALRALAPDCHITALARYGHQQLMARRLGADEIIGNEDPYRAVARITGARLYEGMLGNRMLLGGFDVVFDCVGTSATLQDSLRWARAGGTVVLAGVKLKPLSLDLTPVWYQEVNLIGVNSHGREHWNGREWETFDLVIELLRQGKLTIDGLITHRFPLEKWREAIATAENKRTGAIKVVFDYGH